MLHHTIRSRLPYQRLLTHLLFWICYLGFYTLHWGSHEGNYRVVLEEIILLGPVILAAGYFTVYALLPRLLYAKRYVAFALSLLVSAVLFAFLYRLVVWYFIYPRFYPEALNNGFFDIAKILSGMVHTYTVVFAVTAIKLAKRNYRHERRAQELARKKLDAELQLLKAQIHPHFLFNTLNNLYALTLQNSPRSPEVVLGLSDFLDYMLYECNGPLIGLEREIEQLRNFIRLEQLRHGDRLSLEFVLQGSPAGCRLPPLLLLPFVENAFKHGVSRELTNTWIHIRLSIENRRLTLLVENSKPLEKSERQELTRGIGLKNVTRRLDILFGNRYELKTFDEEETYLIKLKLPLQHTPDDPPEQNTQNKFTHAH